MRYNSTHTAAAVVKQHFHLPEGAEPLGLILGSGFGSFGETLENLQRLSFPDIPGFRGSTAPGHAGQLLYGTLAGRPILCLQGRLHAYEGYDFADVIFPVRVLSLLGVRTLVVTNAAGGIHPDFGVGDLMLICDHINLLGGNPLAGQQDPAFGTRFFDMNDAYSPDLRAHARRCAEALGLGARLREGVYCAVMGPSFETPAEIRAFRVLGADAVGMSTVPEVIAARHAEVKVLGLSLISNLAAGCAPAPPNGEEVLLAGLEASEMLTKFLDHLLQNI